MAIPNADECWAAIGRRDAAFDGVFFTGVLTTGVFCRPSCPARPPLRKNVRFYESPAEAQRDGLRACLRCRPLAAVDADPDAERVQAACRYMDTRDGEAVRLADVAQAVGLSAYHFQRVFRAVTGVTPRQYLEARRMTALKRELRDAGSVTDAIYAAGFGSSSRVYERAGERLGMTPRQYRDGGGEVAIGWAVRETALGPVLVAGTARGLCAVRFGESAAELERGLRAEFPKARLEEAGGGPVAGWGEALQAFVDGAAAEFDAPVDVEGTAFQARVWNYLRRIPAGRTESYSEVAKGIGSPRAVRAVANACAANRVAIAIPCHRVVRGDGELGGYRWGTERKRALLDREGAARGDG